MEGGPRLPEIKAFCCCWPVGLLLWVCRHHCTQVAALWLRRPALYTTHMLPSPSSPSAH
jgi:hypothetical protein